MPKLIAKQKVVKDSSVKNNKIYRELFELNDDAVLIISMKTKRIVEANMISSKMFACTSDKLMKIPANKLFPEFMCEKLCRIGEHNSGFEVNIFERVLLKRCNGEEFYADIRPRRIFSEGEQIMILSIHDVSEQIKNEETMKKHTMEMEKLSNLMIGRELKMVELKKEIKVLKQKLKQND